MCLQTKVFESQAEAPTLVILMQPPRNGRWVTHLYLWSPKKEDLSGEKVGGGAHQLLAGRHSDKNVCTTQNVSYPWFLIR